MNLYKWIISVIFVYSLEKTIFSKKNVTYSQFYPQTIYLKENTPNLLDLIRI